MSLQNIFTMIKADRYTEDGCEELNKAKKEIEDARKFYKPGEISEKTGLQKQPDGGWAPPKGAQQAAGTKQAENGEAPETASGNWQKNEDYLGRERISMKTPQGGKVSIYESDNPKQKNARFRVDTGSHYNEFNTMEEAKAFAEKQYGAESKPDADNNPTGKWEETQMASGKIYDTPDKTHRIIERNDWETGEKTFDIRDLNNMRADDIKGIKTLEEAKRIVAEKKAKDVENPGTKPAEKWERRNAAGTHPMVGQKFNPAQDESEMKWSDGKSHTTYTAKDGTGNDKEGTRRALVVREDENGNGVYGVINYDKITGKINYMKEYGDEGEANREYDALLAKSKSSLNDAVPRVLTGDCRIRIRK